MPSERRSGYRLLDAGDGRRLERFGERVVDRPAPAARAGRRDPIAWAGADLRFAGGIGWKGEDRSLRPWTIQLDGLTLELRPTTSGQLGLFPEHLDSLGWLRDQVRRPATSAPAAVLNLFGYTGLATLALAAAGAAVVHVDAARTAVAWARRNARLSGLEDRPVRWIIDDAAGFVAREVRRGRRYDGIVLDPPTWGHAEHSRAWRLDARLDALLANCAVLAGGAAAFCLLTLHATGHATETMAGALARAFARPRTAIEAGPMELRAESGATLRLGAFARFAA